MGTIYRCPKCSSQHSVAAEKIFDGRLIFKCSKCRICAVVPLVGGSVDESYLEFLDICESGRASTSDDLEMLAQQEKIIRPKKEIDSLISKNNAHGNEMLEQVLRTQQDYVVDFRTIEEPPPESGGKLEDLPIDDNTISLLYEKKIERLYKFQEEAIKKILLGKDIVIVAPTASGKTEAFCIPILQRIAEEVPRHGTLRSPESHRISAVFVYPTKALSRDQLPKIKEFADRLGLSVDVLDGDSGEKERSSVISMPPDVIVTNFDVLHYHMFYKTRFSLLVRNAKFLVVDEAHVYTGVFGANIHYIIKRFERLSATKRLQVVAASATLPNPQEFCDSLFGRKMEVIHGKGRRGKINFLMLFPSLRSNRSLMLEMVKTLTKRKHRTIVFSNSHLGSELLAFYASRQGVSIRVHRAGLLPTVRRHIEQSFKKGVVAAISATPTLELGIDIGDVDAVVSGIVPINRLMQRFGRAARRGQDGYAFLALGNDPISQYYKQHPDDYLDDQEFAYTDPDNQFVQEYQILAMACDKPLAESETRQFKSTVGRLVSQGLVTEANGRYTADLRAARKVLGNYSIRGIGSKVDIKFGTRIIGDRSMPQALEELHKNAIYFMSGRRYQVKNFYFSGADRSHPYVELSIIPSDYPYYTKALTDEWPSILETYEKKKVFGVEVAYCSLKIKKQVFGYANIEIGKEISQGTKVMLEEPMDYEFVTKGLVFRAPMPKDILAGADDEQYVAMSSFHASEHVIIEGSAMVTGGASQDLGGISLGSSGLIFVYDGSIGGNGASRVLYDRFDRAIARALRILSECPCKSESGCPRCTYSYRCGNNNEYLHKNAAIEVLNRVVEGEGTVIGENIHGDRALV